MMKENYLGDAFKKWMANDVVVDKGRWGKGIKGAPQITFYAIARNLVADNILRQFAIVL